MYELIIIWDDGMKEVHEFNTEAEAKAAGEGLEFDFGRQIEWWETRRKS